MKIGVGSKNRTKVDAVREVFGFTEEVFPIEVSSGVSNQPFSDKETLQGAKNRALNLLSVNEELDLGIGLEGGVAESEDGLLLCNWGALTDREGTLFVAGGARILLPEEVAEGVRSGKELSIVMDEYTKKTNIRSKEGAMGIFTAGMVDRKSLFIHIVKLLYGQYQYKGMLTK